MSKSEEETGNWVSQVYVRCEGEVWWGSWNEEQGAWNPWTRLGPLDRHPFDGPDQPVQSGYLTDPTPEHKSDMTRSGV